MSNQESTAPEGPPGLTRDDITNMARQAGLVMGYSFSWANMQTFADLVAAAERERCAMLCEDHFSSDGDWCARVIRRGKE